MRASLQRNVSEIAMTDVRENSCPAFVVVEVRERPRPTRVVPVAGFCFERALSLCVLDTAFSTTLLCDMI